MQTFLDIVANKSSQLQNRWDFDHTTHTQYGDMQHFLMFERLASGDHSTSQNHVVDGRKWVEYQYGANCSFKNKGLEVDPSSYPISPHCMICVLVVFRLTAAANKTFSHEESLSVTLAVAQQPKRCSIQTSPFWYQALSDSYTDWPRVCAWDFQPKWIILDGL